jgi:hypothetical protein
MWGNPTRERERDLIIMLQESTYQQQNNISSQGKYLTAPNLSHRNLPRFSCQNIPLSGLFRTSFSVPTVTCTDCSVRPKNNHQKSENHLENRAKNHLDFVPNPYGCTESVRTVRIRTVRPPTTEKYFGQKFTEIFSRESCPLSLKNVPSLLLTFLSQAYSENLSNSPPDVLSTFDMSCTLPNAFFYNLKMTFSPQKCLFTFPNPRSKGQD